MADFEVLSAEELRDRGLRQQNAEFPELRTGPGTLARLEVTSTARMVADNHVRIGELDKNATPLNANEAGLTDWAEALGVERKAATGARKAQALEVRGSAGAVVPIATELTHSSGLRFKVTAAVTIPSAGLTYADVEAIDTGPSTQLAAGQALRFGTPPAGIEQTARLVLDLDEGGEDAEPLGLWRERVLTRFRMGAQGGNRSDYEQWVLEAVPAASTAYVYPNKPTVGSVSLAGLKSGSGSARALSSGERTAISDYVEPLRPITDNVATLETITNKVHVDVRIGTLPGSAFPWDDSSGFTVAAYNASTRVLDISPAVPSSLSVGDRLVIKSASPDATGADGFPAVVAAILDADEVVLAPYGDRSAPLSWTPQVGDSIYAQSDESDAARAAILDGYQIGCGTDAAVVPGLNQLGPANPAAVHGDWISDVTIARLQAAALSVPGVVSVTVVAPVADVLSEEYEFPDTGKVELLVPGQIIVRSA